MTANSFREYPLSSLDFSSQGHHAIKRDPSRHQRPERVDPSRSEEGLDHRSCAPMRDDRRLRPRHEENGEEGSDVTLVKAASSR